jgi:hypothetical protein
MENNPELLEIVALFLLIVRELRKNVFYRMFHAYVKKGGG